MNRKTWYWIAGIFAILVLIALVWSAWPAEKTPQDAAGGAANSETGGNAHTDHETAQGADSNAMDPNLRSYLDEQDVLMSGMMHDMDNIERSGNASIDFLTGMIPHHASAVTMAEIYLQYGGEHEVLAPLAQDIIRAQKAEIEQMEGMIKDLKENGTTDETKANAYWKSYHELMDHSMAHGEADSLDAAFADGMKMHHQMAVDMANAILPNTDDENVKTLAQTIIDTQKQEIDTMQKVLDELKQD